MSDKNTLLLLCLLFACLSCSHEETVPVEKKYSASTQREFAEIEKGDLKNSIPPAHEIHRPVEKRLTPPTPVAPSQVSGPSSERLQEINQQLAYYCMKHRKAFGTEENCQRFTQKIVNECKSRSKSINAAVVHCIKDRLKKRR